MSSSEVMRVVEWGCQSAWSFQEFRDVRTCPFSLVGNDEWNSETYSQASGKTQAIPLDLEKVFSEKRGCTWTWIG